MQTLLLKGDLRCSILLTDNGKRSNAEMKKAGAGILWLELDAGAERLVASCEHCSPTRPKRPDGAAEITKTLSQFEHIAE